MKPMGMLELASSMRCLLKTFVWQLPITRRCGAVQGLVGWAKEAYPLWVITLAVWLPIWFYNTQLAP